MARKAFRLSQVLFVALLTSLIALPGLSAAMLGQSGRDLPSRSAGTKRPLAKGDTTFAAPGPLTFLPVVPYQMGGLGGWAVATADFNGDGVLDLVMTEGDQLIGVSLGNGDGTFKPVLSLGTNGIIPTNLIAADVNSDGKPDVIVSGLMFGSNSDAGGLAVFLGKGDGSFQSPVVYDSGGTFPYSLGTADLNADGNVDIVVADCSPITGSPCGLFGILLGNGDGTFQRVLTYNSGGFGAWALTVADLNGDNKQDLVIGNLCANANCSGDGAVAVLLGNGDGTFQSPVTYDSGGRTLVPAIADVNGDGKPDILVANGQGNVGLGVLIGNGDGSFRPVITYGVGQKYVSSLAIGDFNKDSKVDVVVSVCNSGQYTCEANASVVVLLGNGDGTFQTPISYSSGGWYSVGLAVADFNDDGQPDIAVANCAPDGGLCNGSKPGVIGVLLNDTSSGRLSTTTAIRSSPNPSFVGQTIAFTATVSSSSGPPPNGETVTFHNGSAILGTSSLNSGVATLATSSLGVGTYTITATYAGDSNFATSTSAGLKQVVNSTTKSPTSTMLASSLNPSTYGQTVTFTATVTNNGGSTPTGKVSFTWGTNSIGTATLNSSGVATLIKSNLNVQAFPLTAVYQGDANNVGSTSPVLTQVVNQTTSKATLTSSPNPSIVGQEVTFTATITSPTVKATGPVTFKAGNAVLGTIQLTNGKATLTSSSLPAGSTVVKVIYKGDSNIKSSSASVTQVVQ